MATTLNIKDAKGADAGSMEINEAWLEREKGEQAVKDSVVAFMAACRAGTASTKTRGKVSGGGAKPWRQKGNGRARAGSSRSPVWRGGGIAFGPQPRSYDKKVNKKVEKLALRRAFTDRVDQNEVILVDEIPDMRDNGAPKTKKMIAFLEAIGAGQNALVLDVPVDECDCEECSKELDRSYSLELAANNLGSVLVMNAASVNPYYLMYFRKVVITKAGLEVLGARLG